MLSGLSTDVEFKEIGKDEFCEATKHAMNSVGHTATIDLINQLCGSKLQINRISIKVNVGDEIYIIMSAIRLEEGKILKSDEIYRMYEEGKVKFIRAMVYGAVLKELVDCEGACNELAYDALAHKAKFG